MFTYARLLNPGHLQATTAGALLTGISQYIFHTWGVNIDPGDLDLRWSDATGDVFALRDYQTIIVSYKKIAQIGPGRKMLEPLVPQQLSPARISRTSCVCHVIKRCRPITFCDCSGKTGLSYCCCAGTMTCQLQLLHVSNSCSFCIPFCCAIVIVSRKFGFSI